MAKVGASVGLWLAAIFIPVSRSIIAVIAIRASRWYLDLTMPSAIDVGDLMAALRSPIIHVPEWFNIIGIAQSR